MAEIKLTRGLSAIVDDEDYVYLNKFNWYAGLNGYATRIAGGRKSRKGILMHRLIMEANDKSIEVDHINGVRLDNRRSNLRLATRSQNAMNSKLSNKNTSGFKGVTFDTWTNNWKAQIRVNHKNISLGRYETKEQAAEARKEGEKKYHGEFAYGVLV